MTEPIYPIVINPANVPPANVQVLISPNVNFVVHETEDENEMCVVCNINKQNIKFLPCGHTTTCSVCAQEIMNRDYQNQLKCPMCRQIVTNIDSFFM